MASIIVGSIAAAVVGILGGIVFGPNADIVRYGSFEKGGPERAAEEPPVDSDKWVRRNVYFTATDGEQCHGWFYLPKVAPDGGNGGSGGSKKEIPLVVMASGLGAQICFGMDKYAEAFASSGLAVFLFDYRGFGSSGGMPRNLADPWRHLDDWRSALAFVKNA